jgi:hypothetical protein
VTANPEVIGLTTVGGLTVTGSTDVNIEFQLDMATPGAIDYSIYQVHEFGNWGNTLDNETGISQGTSVDLAVASDDLEECGNVITVIATSNKGDKGRDAITVYKDTTPPKPNFDLGFGDHKIIVDFTASFLCDLDRYEIFYGSGSGSTVLDSHTALESAYDKKTISGPTAGKSIESTIKSLTNGVPYYVYLVVFDNSGNYAISDRKSTVPDKVATFTERAGEDGGVNCLGSVSPVPAGGPVKLFGLLCPLLVAGSLLVLLRRRS